MKILKFAVLALALFAAACSKPAPKAAGGQAPVKLVLDWQAEAEHGGYYEALATGEYARRGLAVTIVPGGPSTNVAQLVASGQAEFGIGSNSFVVMHLAEQSVPVTAVAAFFQKDPQVLIAHPDTGVNSIADMKGHPILLSDDAITGFWVWLKAKYGFTDDQVRKYNNSNAPFLADARVVQQGYLMSEPYTIETQGHIKPVVFLLADEGYPSYASLVLTSNAYRAGHADVVRAFNEATAAGWRNYLHGDPKPADDLILKNNPEMSEAVLAQARDRMRQTGLVESGDAATGRIGVMTDARWADFYRITSAAKGVYEKPFDPRTAYSLDYLPAAQPAATPAAAPAAKP
ncbi:MAG TPA: ABC transporter substrate-binding protein [Caulobacteraceae bacterium]|nr:ABC transporter substrate-binding protein [Caulobacteraceae bacterium]